VAYQKKGEYDRAIKDFDESIKLNPNNASAHYFYGFTLLMPQLRLDEALREFQSALSLDPLSPIINTNYGWTLMVAQRYDDSMAQYQRTTQRDPNFGAVHFKFSHLYSAMGRFPEAINEIKKSDMITVKAATLDAKVYCDANQTISGADREVSTALACAAIDRELALRSMRKAYENHDLVGEFIRSPEFDPLRSDPRYIEIMRNMGLNP